MPDIFIPLDTTGITDYFLDIRNSGLIYRYAMKYTEDNRETLRKYNDLPALSKWLDDQNLLSKFVTYAGQNGVPANKRQIDISGKIIAVQLKAYIARNMLDNKGFYPIWQEIDRTLLDALSYLENN